MLLSCKLFVAHPVLIRLSSYRQINLWQAPKKNNIRFVIDFQPATLNSIIDEWPTVAFWLQACPGHYNESLRKRLKCLFGDLSKCCPINHVSGFYYYFCADISSARSTARWSNIYESIKDNLKNYKARQVTSFNKGITNNKKWKSPIYMLAFFCTTKKHSLVLRCRIETASRCIYESRDWLNCI